MLGALAEIFGLSSIFSQLVKGDEGSNAEVEVKVIDLANLTPTNIVRVWHACKHFVQ